MRVSHAARWACSGVSILALSCGGSDGSTGPSGGKVSLDASRAASDSVGISGGTITATSGSGVRYTLQIPAGALESKVKITLTPITGVKSLPVSGGFSAGADFQPAGLHFALPARLSVSPTGTAPSGMQLIALTFEGDADSLGLTPVADSSGTKIVFLTHFSGASFVFGTTADVQALAQSATTASASQPFINQITALGPITPPGNPAALPILQQWFTNVILPGIQGAGSDAELILAVGDYDLWANVAATSLSGNVPIVNLSGPPQQPSLPASLAPLVTQASAAAAPVLRAAIAGNNSTCLAQRNLQSMLNEFFWQDYASYFHVATLAEHLDRPSIVTNLCGEVRLDSSKLVDPIPKGQAQSFDMVWGFLIGHSPPVIPANFQVTVSATGATVSPASGLTGPNPQGGPITQGFFTTVVNGSPGATATFSATACLIPPGETAPIAGLCHTEIVTRQVTGQCDLVITGDLALFFGDTRVDEIREVDGTLSIFDFASVTLPCLTKVGTLDMEAGNWPAPGELKLPALSSINRLQLLNTPGLKSVVMPPGLPLHGLQLASPSLRSISDLGDVIDGGTVAIGSDSLTLLRVGHISAGTLELGSTGRESFTIAGIDAEDIRVGNFLALSDAHFGTVNAGTMELFGNVTGVFLGGFSSNSVLNGFFFTPDSHLSESEALAFANRITVKTSVCQLVGGQAGKCYQGPPWH